MKRALKTVWDYFRPSWEGTDKKFSYKRFSQFIFLHLMVMMVVKGISSQYEYYTFLTLAVIFTLVAGIMTVQELILMIKYYSKHSRFDYFNPGNSEDTESVDALLKDEDKPQD